MDNKFKKIQHSILSYIIVTILLLEKKISKILLPGAKWLFTKTILSNKALNKVGSSVMKLFVSEGAVYRNELENI